jgi:hypothetical protein
MTEWHGRVAIDNGGGYLQPFFEHKTGQCHGGLQLKFLHNVLSVRFYGIDAQVEMYGYLLVRVLLVEQLQYLRFPPG